jgi:heat-inducible transcriptional repressor
MSDPKRQPTGPATGPAARPPLSEREAVILRSVVTRFIRTASPVGSKVLAEQGVVELSSASIRNTLSALEDYGYLDHPHTSAGRIPTDLGYRAYVDELMDLPGVQPAEQKLLRAGIEQVFGDVESLMRETSRLLGQFTNLLGVVLSPRLATGVLERLDVVPLSSSRLMFVVSVRGGLVKTIVAELDAEVRRSDLDRVVQAMNERLAGLTLEEVRQTAVERMRDLDARDGTGVVRLVLDEAAALFAELPKDRQAEVGGAQQIVTQPEFQEPGEVRSVIELMENHEILVHLLEAGAAPPGAERARPESAWPDRAVVLIGHESDRDDRFGGKYSVVKAQYRFGDTAGSLGVIGPKRMDYAYVVTLVEYLAGLLSGTAPDA